jgi:conjugal transfer pilus assembly protein TraU
MKYITLIVLLVLSLYTECDADCSGKFPNPITDVCWECMFPIRVGGVKLSNGEEANAPKRSVCVCPKPPLNQPTPGFVVSYFEPARMVDVTRHPYCLVNMGGLVLGSQRNSPKDRGTVSLTHGEGGLKNSFFHVHWYVFPVFAMFELLTDIVCVENTKFDVAFLTEFDPFWNRDELSLLLNPEAILFGNPIAQGACIADGTKASFGFGFDSLFWCAGCHGSIYPFTGSVAAHVSGVQATELIVTKFMAHLHRAGLLNVYYGGANTCKAWPCPIIKKSMYKLQMTNPVAATDKCMPIGRSDFLHQRHAQREIIQNSMNYGYLIFRRRECCFL